MNNQVREVRWERMYRHELEAALATNPVVYFSHGLCEPHGPHAVLGLDTLKAHKLCVLAAHTFGGIVAPPESWHVQEQNGYAAWMAYTCGEVRSWCTAVPYQHHFKSVAYQVRAAHQNGFEAAIFLTGHYGPNWMDLKHVLEWLQPYVAPRLYGVPDFEACTVRWDGSNADHAGKVETSQLWALEPDMVDMRRLPADPANRFACGDTAAEAHYAKGCEMVQSQVEWLGNKAEELRAAYAALRLLGPRPEVTFATIDAVWDAKIEPALPDFACAKPCFADYFGAPPLSSRWYPHWKGAL